MPKVHTSFSQSKHTMWSPPRSRYNTQPGASKLTSCSLPGSASPPVDNDHSDVWIRARVLLPVFGLYINGVTQYTWCCDWLLSPNIISVRRIPMWPSFVCFHCSIVFHCAHVTRFIHFLGEIVDYECFHPLPELLAPYLLISNCKSQSKDRTSRLCQMHLTMKLFFPNRYLMRLIICRTCFRKLWPGAMVFNLCSSIAHKEWESDVSWISLLRQHTSTLICFKKGSHIEVCVCVH